MDRGIVVGCQLRYLGIRGREKTMGNGWRLRDEGTEWEIRRYAEETANTSKSEKVLQEVDEEEMEKLEGHKCLRAVLRADVGAERE